MTQGWRVEHHASLASTSDTCADRARIGDPGRLMIVAAEQTAGRGRAGRVWSSPPGNFYASVLLRPDIPAVQGGLFALLAGLSLFEAIQQASGSDGAVRLKWPNDIMVGYAKLAGILLDATIDSGLITTLIIGFGVNDRFAPEVPDRATTSLAAWGLRHAPNELATFLCERIDHWQGSLKDDSGSSLRTAWQVNAYPPGTPLTIDSGRITGIYEGIDPDGSLRLRQGTTLRIIRSGDVAVL